MLNRLMGWPVLTKTDAVMGQHIDDMLFHQTGQADGRPHIIGEDKKCTAIGNQASMQGHTVQNSGHAEFAHAEMDIPLVAGSCLKALFIIDQRFIRWGKISRTAHQAGDILGNGV